MKTVWRFSIVLLIWLLVQPLFAETLFGKEGWILFHTDQDGTKSYYRGQTTAVAGNHRAKYVAVYKVPKEYNLIYGYTGEVEIQCGWLKRTKTLSVQPFGKGGPDNLLLNPSPPDKDYKLLRKDTVYYSLSQLVCK